MNKNKVLERRKIMEKNYCIEIELKFSNSITASSKEEAKYLIEEIFKESYGLILTKDEIKSIKEDSK